MVGAWGGHYLEEEEETLRTTGSREAGSWRPGDCARKAVTRAEKDGSLSGEKNEVFSPSSPSRATPLLPPLFSIPPVHISLPSPTMFPPTRLPQAANHSDRDGAALQTNHTVGQREHKTQKTKQTQE